MPIKVIHLYNMDVYITERIKSQSDFIQPIYFNKTIKNNPFKNASAPPSYESIYPKVCLFEQRSQKQYL
ncbi:hypothetical protein AHEVV1_011 [Adoxophyes honmai entomopoxvirus 'L' virophage 1]|nr:hypothetical protein AHEVV1_011 [Adoxophyes honmai entomopoxvirus 'L' virophage 1]